MGIAIQEQTLFASTSLATTVFYLLAFFAALTFAHLASRALANALNLASLTCFFSVDFSVGTDEDAALALARFAAQARSSALLQAAVILRFLLGFCAG